MCGPPATFIAAIAQRPSRLRLEEDGLAVGSASGRSWDSSPADVSTVLSACHFAPRMALTRAIVSRPAALGSVP